MSAAMKLAPQGMQTNDKQVTAQDQKKINKFARLNTTLEEGKVELSRMKTDLQNLADASDELLLVEDEDSIGIPIKIGDTFLLYNFDSAQERIEMEKSKLEADQVELNKQQEAIMAEMAKLKVELYAKFGSSINLEPDDD